MRVTKRNGQLENVSFDKVLNRIEALCKGLNIDPAIVSQKVCSRIADGITTAELDELAAQLCSSMMSDNAEYGVLAGRLIVSNHQKNTSPSFSEAMTTLFNNISDNGEHQPVITRAFYDLVMANKEKLNSCIDYSRDFNYEYFSFKTLEYSYLLRAGGKVVERPQHMFLRVALAIHKNDIKDVIETYDYMPQKYFIHATPTLFNAGAFLQQCSSCFLLALKDDSIEGIYDTLKDTALISKLSGGLGISVSNVRCKGSRIKGTNGISSGIIPMLRVFNDTARYVDQAGRRKGSFAIYLEVWHADILEFIELRKNHGNEHERARDLFLALWLNDLFMERVRDNGPWRLMCQTDCPGLQDAVGPEFKALYESYERAGKFRKEIPAQKLWNEILKAQIETGTPYLMYKDAANMKSNQKALGTIRSSNLCSEIVQYSDDKETAVCNLASIALPMYIVTDATTGKKSYDFKLLHKIAGIITKNLNKVIDINHYPTPQTERSNKLHRPIGIGVQGLADTYAIMGYPFESEEAADLNRKIFETIYHGAVSSSIAISRKRGELIKEMKAFCPDDARAMDIMDRVKLIPEELNLTSYPGAYSSFEQSPAAQGLLQFDLWNKEPGGLWDWPALKADMKLYGLRNSLLVAPMPTASTSQILSFNECFEPFTSNLYQRRTLAGEFIVVNKYLIKDMTELGLWNADVREAIIVNNGCIQNIPGIPDHIKALYKTVWEIKQKALIDQSADRGIYVCQSQSLNLFVEEPDIARLTAMHFYAWNKGLKTGMYYLRTRPKAKAQQFSIEPEKKASTAQPLFCSRDNPDCIACSA